MEIEKTSRISLVEQVVAQIEKLIEGGAWPVGTRLPPETELMEQFAVSRNTLREAVRALVHAGLLQTRQGSGTTVCASSGLGAALQRRLERASLLETLEVRLALEREAASLSAARRSEEDLAEFRAQLAACTAAADVQDRLAYAEADFRLHLAIVKASRNRLLLELYGHMTEAVESSVHETVALTPFSVIHQTIHTELVDAIANGDAKRAAAAVDEYIWLFREAVADGREVTP
ncbi:GntR family transcriptional regulator [Paenibacillus sp. J31TS4]|uniref:FadR/GntR family transcriptional regulator n=1 Tax=Paenibacillus sp. J31TS4 TaxID=2807195 RepID=UPI001B0B18E7|nr:FadR/GntR family transcriptional regulator [Paenibacillus sp. J31TS4]GIP41417.1 GntR family transcriptional regulator [Paenibacillus sp. J31TS4]